MKKKFETLANKEDMNFGEEGENPYALITKEIVQDALTNDIGPKAKLVSFDIRDFTKKGDNYSSIVTSVLVRFQSNGRMDEKTFVAKLNPLRPINDLSSMMESMYGRETIIMSQIIPGMNIMLKNIKQPPIKTPRVHAANTEKRQEIFIAEDLRRSGYSMYDRKKGMDIQHGMLVLEELGRFHASSVIFEDSLPTKSLKETFKYFEEPWFDLENPLFKTFNEMVEGACENAIQLLTGLSKYEKCIRWFQTNMESIGKIFIEYFYANKPFEVLSHADCWTNNLLFRYDGDRNPLEVRFIDFQAARMSSPACDINYFLYSSLSGKVRRENFRLLCVTYYLSFAKMFLLNGREPPFTYKELEDEVRKKKAMGLFSGVLLLPIVLAEEDDLIDLSDIDVDDLLEYLEDRPRIYQAISSKESAFKDRFLALFDDMLEYNIFDT